MFCYKTVNVDNIFYFYILCGTIDAIQDLVPLSHIHKSGVS